MFHEDGNWIAQCLEYDIFAFGNDFDTVMARFQATLDAEAALAPEGADNPFSHIPPAPEYFHVMWAQKRTILRPLGSVELAIAA